VNILQKPWFLGLLAALLHLVPTWYFMNEKMASLIPAAEEIVAMYDEASHVEEPSLELMDWSYQTREILKLALDLREEKDRLNEREASLSAMEKRLAAEREELKRVRDDLERFRTSMDDIFLTIEDGQKRNLESLAKTYSMLDPAAAVAIFREMDELTVIRILSLMKEQTLAPILEAIVTEGTEDPEAAAWAARLSESLRVRVVADNP